MGKHDLDVGWIDLVWAAITVGKPGIAHLFSHGWHSISDVIVRSHTVYANLRTHGALFRRSSLYNAQDPSEKSGTSYFLGMMAAKLIAERLLDTPWLMHVSMFTSSGGTVRLHGNSEPDLIGIRRNGDWIVMEAKGRSGRFSSVAMAKAKTQTRQLRKINGQFPILRVGVQAHFSPNLCFSIEDPEEYEEDARDFSGDLELATRRYYSSILLATTSSSETRNIAGREFQTRHLEEIGVTVGIERKIREILSGDNAVELQLRQILEDSKETLGAEEEGTSVFGDGVLIELDGRWSDENMQRNPTLRNRIT